MKANLIVFIFVSFFVDQIDGSKWSDESKFLSFNEKSLDLIGDNNGDVLDGPFCKSIVAYYVGILQNKKSKQTHNVQFQLKLWIDDEKKKIHVYADKWNEKYSKSEDFELDFYYDGNRLWCDIYDDNCVSPIAKQKTSFKLDLNTKSGNYFHLLNFNHFNNSFVLNKPMEKCTKHQLDTLNDHYTPDLSQLGFCVCCEDYEPDELLVCPSNKWSDKETTQKSLKTTEKPETTQKVVETTQTKVPTPPIKPIKTTPSLIPHDQVCQKIVGYYVGTFQRMDYLTDKFDAQFRLEIDSNLEEKKLYYGITNWNLSYIKVQDDGLRLKIDDHPNGGEHFCETPNTNCSVPLATYSVDRYVMLGRTYINWWFNILEFPFFNNSFTLVNAIDGCTRNQPHFTEYDYKPNPSKFSYCLCCDKYKPHPSLNCPQSPFGY